MRNSIYIFLLIILLLSCNNSQNKTSENIQKKQLDVKDLKKDFKFSNLNEFSIDTFTWENRPGKYKELDSTSFYLIFQNGKRDFIGENYNRDYLFSWQNRDTNFLEFTILTQDESDYCDIKTYFIFDKKVMKLINS